MRQFHGLLVKRFHCARRNSKALSSQILLPAFFVCVAMTVALSVPEIGTAAWPGTWTSTCSGATWGGALGVAAEAVGHTLGFCWGADPKLGSPVGTRKRGSRPAGCWQAVGTC